MWHQPLGQDGHPDHDPHGRGQGQGQYGEPSDVGTRLSSGEPGTQTDGHTQGRQQHHRSDQRSAHGAASEGLLHCQGLGAVRESPALEQDEHRHALELLPPLRPVLGRGVSGLGSRDPPRTTPAVTAVQTATSARSRRRANRTR